MPNRQKHRGAHSKDSKLFAREVLPNLAKAAVDLAYLLTNNYPLKASLKLVGDKFRFHERQRKALRHIVCSEQAKKARFDKEVSVASLKDQVVFIDGFNVLIVTESLLADGMVFRCMDSAYRDIASVHSTYKRVEETEPALKLLGKVLEALEIQNAIWVLDQPISNSGRLKTLMQSMAIQHNWPWEIRLEYNPDRVVATSDAIAISSDSWVLDNTENWYNLTHHLIQQENIRGWIIDFFKPTL